MAVDMSQVPPQIQQALMQQQQAGASPSSIGDMLEQLMQMNPEQVAQVLTQMGIQVTPDQVQTAAKNWVEAAGDKAAGGGDEEDPAPAETQDEEAGDAPNLEQAEAAAGETPTDEAAEGEEGADEAQLPAGAQPTSYSPAQQDQAMQRGGAMRGSAGGVPVRGGAGVPTAGAAGPPMDDIISSMMMQGAAGNPNAPVPMPPGAGAMKVPRGAARVPHSASAAASSDPRMKAMIGNIYRSVAGQTAGAERSGAPAGPRGTTTPSANLRRARGY